jgi:glycosyltransferase involved in cell wall biosynthesis
MPVPVLHCYADFKWTGPSEPVLQLCVGLSARGWRSDLAVMQSAPGWRNELAERARTAGIQATEAFEPPSRPGPLRALRDRRRLSHLIAQGGYRIVHCHGSWDHAIVGWTRSPHNAHAARVLRTDHGAREYRARWTWRYYFGPRMVDHLIVLSDRYVVRAVNQLRLAPRTVTAVRGAVNTEVFRPLDPPAGMRGSLSLAREDVLIGIVARVQRHRRFGVLLEAARIAKERDRRVKILVCGRGTRKAGILDRPVARQGLGDTVVSLGYRRDDYRETIALFDAGLMLVPGSDGSCRAAMEMAAMAKPLVVARRGVLPDIVRDAETGIVVEDAPENLAEAILEMAADAGRRKQWGEAGRERMCRHFSLSRQADEVIAVYERLLV